MKVFLFFWFTFEKVKKLAKFRSHPPLWNEVDMTGQRPTAEASEEFHFIFPKSLTGRFQFAGTEPTSAHDAA